MSTGVPVLVEGFVVARTCEELQRRGWTTTAVLATSHHGDDIVARRGGDRLRVEAKGVGSSVATSNRYGKPFNAGQVTISVGQAVFKALQVLEAGDRAGIALPDTLAFRAKVQSVSKSVERLGLAIFWVSEDNSVIVENAPAIE